MSEEDDFDLRLETRLGEELRQQLDRQLGRAAPYFLRRSDVGSDCLPTIRRRRGQWLAGLTAVAAACCAGFIAWEWYRPAQLPDGAVGKAIVAVDSQRIATSRTKEAQSKRDGHSDHEAETSPPADRAPFSAERSPAPEALILASALSTRTLDDGVLLVGRTPVRKLRRQWLERVEWFDPHNGARVQRIVPHEEVLFVPLPIN